MGVLAGDGGGPVSVDFADAQPLAGDHDHPVGRHVYRADCRWRLHGFGEPDAWNTPCVVAIPNVELL